MKRGGGGGGQALVLLLSIGQNIVMTGHFWFIPVNLTASLSIMKN